MALAKSVSISCNRDLLNKLNEYCSERGCSRSRFVNQAIEHYMAELEALEDREDYEEGNTAWHEHIKSGGITYPAAEVFKEAGL